MTATYSETLTTFVSSTLDDHASKIENQVFKSTDMMKYISAHRKKQVGGKNVFVNLEFGENSSIQRAMGRGGKITLSQDEIITQAHYAWTSYAGGIIRYRDDELENTGKYAVFNMMQAYIKNLEKSFAKTLEEDLFSTEAVGVDKFCGLRGLVEDIDISWDDTDEPGTDATTPSTKTVGNLSRGTYGWWCNYGYDMTDLDPAQWLTIFMRDAVDGVETWASGCEAIICHRTVKNFYEDEVGETLRTVTVKLGDVRIRSVEYGGIPFITSPYSPKNRMWFIGKDTLSMVYEPRMWFRNTDWKEPTQQPFDKARQMVVKGQVVNNNPKGTAVVFGINLTS